MAAGDFLKVAAAQLRRASMVLKQEARGMLSERENTARQKSRDITDAQLKLKAKQVELINPNRGQQEKQETAKEAIRLQQEITSGQQEMQKVTQELADRAGKKQSQAQRLDGHASELESQAGAL